MKPSRGTDNTPLAALHLCKAASGGGTDDDPGRTDSIGAAAHLPETNRREPRLGGPGRAARPGVAARGAADEQGRSAALDRRHSAAALDAARQARHLSDNGRRAVAPGDARLQAETGADARPAHARVVHQGPADRPAARSEVDLLCAA